MGVVLLKEEVSETVGLSIGFRFGDGDIGTMEPRLGMARQVLQRVGCQINNTETRTLTTGVREVEVLVVCPIEVRGIHHRFDSILNKSYPDGCGAAWVLEI